MAKRTKTPYHHTTFKDRVLIEKLIQDNIPTSGIALIIGKHKNSISMEIAYSGADRKSYSALNAQLRIT
ncbi:MAG: hypothetical protein NC293_03500 [Roseburia sp.]|nr:hypothetical protein [Roseburia sp.]